MKKKLPLVLEIILGIILVCAGYFIMDTDYYSTLFFAMGFGLVFAANGSRYVFYKHFEKRY